MKKFFTFLFAVGVIVTSNVATAQVIAEFDRANSAGCVSSAVPTLTVANLSAMALCRGAGLVMGSSGSSYNSRSFDTANSTAADAVAVGDELTFSVTPSSGFAVEITQLNIRLDRSPSGPPNYEIRATHGATTTVVATGTISASGGEHNLATSISSTSTVFFQVLLWGASSGSGTCDVEGSTFGGTNTLADPGIQILGTVNASLPIRLSSFTANKFSNKSIFLKWATLSETNNEYFSLEYSKDGQYFEELAQVKGAGTTFEEQNYSFMHKTPIQGENYYRLRQIDYDGTFSYSLIQTVMLEKGTVFSLYPSIAKDYININVPDKFSYKEASLIVFDINGRKLITQSILNDSKSLLDISHLKNGYYFVRIEGKGIVEIARFMKIN